MPPSVIGKMGQLKKKFMTLDKNGDGTLSLDEMVALLQRGDPNMTKTDVKKLFNNVDQNSDGRVQFDEFVAFLYNKGSKRRF
mmetsp:Transcript_5206/g.5727  ORF Transcript_5206/g.5727 Transcript_5206/m.5727 type:complete len:82 (-) Transcript_5206:105-350(-)